MKLKHNKKRNTAFIFEALVRELTRSVVSKNPERKKKIISVIREHFKIGTHLARELKLYKILTENKDLDEMAIDTHTAHQILQETKVQHGDLDSEVIYSEQSNLIKAINRALSKDVFSNFVPNYKSLATVYQIFNSSTTPQKRVLLENEAASLMVERANNSEVENKIPSDNIVYRTFVDKFNESYSSGLLKEQRDLVNKFITSFADNSISLKIFLNDEIGRLKSIIREVRQRDQISTDPEMLEKTEKVLTLMESFKNEHVGASTVEKILKIQQLVGEIQD